MLFNSIEFIIFFPIVVFLYYAIPQKYKNIWLVVASYYFYACWSVKYVLVLSFTTVATYLGARFMQGKHKKCVLISCLTVNLLILAGLKYWGIGISLLDAVFPKWNIGAQAEAFSVVLPIGMSFYVLQSLGYVIDVYRGKTEAEKDLVKYALFVSFFPTLLSGPIERSGNLLKQIRNGTMFSYDRAKNGLLLMVYGFFEKILIANRIGVLVDQVYSNYMDHNGSTIAYAVVLYAIYIYTDFAGYSHIALGAAKVLGFEIIENFKQPYFALNIRDFWKRWHVSLSQWLQEYVYISLGGNRKGKTTTYRNLMLTFLISGLWHGNGLTYLVWGGLHGGYQIIGRMTEAFRNRVKDRCRINTQCWSYRFFQGTVTFLLVDFAWLFFGADSLFQALEFIRKICFRFNLGEALAGRDYLLGMDEQRFVILWLEIVVVLLVDLLHEKKVSVTAWLNAQNKLFRWIVYLGVVFVILVGALYNYGAEASAFIYTRF